MTRRKCAMIIELSYEELVGVYAPLWDASQMIKSMGSSDIVSELADKLESAKTPIREHIDRIERENPDQFR
jgi:translation initiation factor 6 (eIF-6)